MRPPWRPRLRRPDVAVPGCGPKVAYPAATAGSGDGSRRPAWSSPSCRPGRTPWRWTLVWRRLFGPIPIQDAGMQADRRRTRCPEGLDVRAARISRGTGRSRERLYSLVRLGNGDWLLPDSHG
jgi:hypothetical protein